MTTPAEHTRIVELVGLLWDAESKRRGEAYFRGGRVTLEHVDSEQARAIVRGDGGVYTAVFEHERGVSWTVECSCPVARRAAHCKHLWALALALDHAGWRFENVDQRSLRHARLVRTNGWRSRLAEIRAQSRESAPRVEVERQAHLAYVLRLDQSHSEDTLVVEVRKRHVLKSGAWSKPTNIGALSSAFVSDLGERDQRAIALLRGTQDGNAFSYNSRFRLDVTQAEVLLPLMAQDGALTFVQGSGEPSQPLAFDADERWSLQRDIATDADKREVVIDAHWRAGELREPLANVVAMLAGGFLVFPQRLGRVASNHDLAWARAFAANGPLRVPEADKGELARELALMHDDLAMHSAIVSVRHDVAPIARLRLGAPKQVAGEWSDLAGVIAFEYDGQLVGASDTSMLLTSVEPWIARSEKRERELLRRPLELGASSDSPGVLEVPLASVAQLVQTLSAEGWLVEGEGARYRTGGKTRWSLASGVDWFDLAGELDFGGATSTLPKLIAALRHGERTLTLDDGSVGVLPEDWLERYGALVSLGTTRGGLVRFKSSQAWLLDTLLAEQEEARVDQGFRDQVARLSSFRGIVAATEPPGFCGELRPYQRDGLGWLEFLEQQRFGGCLADDMGLGKTVQVLAWLVARRTRRAEHAPTLVVAPRSLTHNWISEAHRFAPQLTTLDYTGSARKSVMEELMHSDIVVTTYGTVRNDIKLLGDERFDCVVLDESQAIKNANSLTAKAVRLLQAEHRIALSGTPIENHLGELWSLFEFLNPGMLGRSSVFSELVAARRDRALGDDARALLAKAIRPFVLRRTKDQVLRDLPQKTEQTIECDLEGVQRSDYDELRQHYRLTLLGKAEEGAPDSFTVLEALLRLRQAACHPGLIDPRRTGESSAKLDTLLEMVDEVIDAGHKALIFSQFTSFLAIVRQRMTQRGLAHAYLDGSTPAKERVAEIERFQSDPACPLFLLSLKAGGVGLNLTAADYVFLLDPWWNPAVEAQAIGRAHRIGQTRCVFAYKLIAADTIEARVLDLQARKRELAAVILDGEAATLRDLTQADLEQLLR